MKPVRRFRNVTTPPVRGRIQGYLLIEALVYISVLFVVLGVAYLAVYRYMDHSVTLRHNADDITSALSAGERWRLDIRASTNIVRSGEGENAMLTLSGPSGTIDYRFFGQVVFRRSNSGTWTHFLSNVESSTMAPEPRQKLTAWSWELELKPRVKTKALPRMRPLFTFLAVPDSKAGL